MTQWFSWKRLIGGWAKDDVEQWPPPVLEEPETEASERSLPPVSIHAWASCTSRAPDGRRWRST
jgi:hypothetical protein